MILESWNDTQKKTKNNFIKESKMKPHGTVNELVR